VNGELGLALALAIGCRRVLQRSDVHPRADADDMATTTTTAPTTTTTTTVDHHHHRGDDHHDRRTHHHTSGRTRQRGRSAVRRRCRQLRMALARRLAADALAAFERRERRPDHTRDLRRHRVHGQQPRRRNRRHGGRQRRSVLRRSRRADGRRRRAAPDPPGFGYNAVAVLDQPWELKPRRVAVVDDNVPPAYQALGEAAFAANRWTRRSGRSNSWSSPTSTATATTKR
jgi:hypothetical protein